MDKKKKGGRPKIPLITPDLEEDGIECKLPPKQIILEQVLYWMDLGATAQEVAGSFHVGVRTLDRRLREETGLGFGELKEKVCGRAKIELRKNQFNLTRTNASMGIWLGKQWLGQKENVEDQVKDLVIDGIRSGIKELLAKHGSEILSKSEMEIEQSLSDS